MTDELWIERAARLTGMRRLASAIGNESHDIYLFGAFVVFLDLVVLSGAAFLRYGYHPVLDTPVSLLVVPAVFFGLWGVRRMRDLYRNAVRQVETVDDERVEQLSRIVPVRAKQGLYVAALAIYLVVLSRGHLAASMAAEGPFIGAFTWLVFHPLTTAVVIVEFITLFLGITVVLPWRIRRMDLDIDFSDPTDFGGLKPVGILIKRSYFIYAVALLLYTVWAYSGWILASYGMLPVPSVKPPGPLVDAFFWAAWLAGIIIVGHALYVIAHYMTREKERKLAEVDAEIRALGDDPHSYPDTQPSKEEIPQFMHAFMRLESVKATNERPVDFHLLQEIALSILIPLAGKIIVSALVVP